MAGTRNNIFSAISRFSQSPPPPPVTTFRNFFFARSSLFLSSREFLLLRFSSLYLICSFPLSLSSFPAFSDLSGLPPPPLFWQVKNPFLQDRRSIFYQEQSELFRIPDTVQCRVTRHRRRRCSETLKRMQGAYFGVSFATPCQFPKNFGEAASELPLFFHLLIFRPRLSCEVHPSRKKDSFFSDPDIPPLAATAVTHTPKVRGRSLKSHEKR